MKYLACTAVAVATLLSTPALAQSSTDGTTLDRRGEAVRAARAERVRSPDGTGPVVTRRDDRPNEPNWEQINRQLIARANNAVDGGADPAAVREALHAYRQQLRRRWNAANGGN